MDIREGKTRPPLVLTVTITDKDGNKRVTQVAEENLTASLNEWLEGRTPDSVEVRPPRSK